MTQTATQPTSTANMRQINTGNYGKVTLRILQYGYWARNAAFVYLERFLPGDIAELSHSFNAVAKGEYRMERATPANMGGSDSAQLMITKKGMSAAGLNPDLEDLYAIADLVAMAFIPVPV